MNPETGKPYTYKKDGFEATPTLSTDQFGTQLDPPAHWAPEYPAIDELPATYAVRPLAVISIVDQVARRPGLPSPGRGHRTWEKQQGHDSRRLGRHGAFGLVEGLAGPGAREAEGSSRACPRCAEIPARERHILFHGHEPLDTDTTPTLEGEHWLMHNGYAQAEGVANLDQVPRGGCLISIGYPKFQGGLGGYARYIAICPANWNYGVSVAQVPEAPLPGATRTCSGTTSSAYACASNGSNRIAWTKQSRLSPQTFKDRLKSKD